MPDSGRKMRSDFRPPASVHQGYHKLEKSTLPSPMTPFYTLCFLEDTLWSGTWWKIQGRATRLSVMAWISYGRSENKCWRDHRFRGLLLHMNSIFVVKIGLSWMHIWKIVQIMVFINPFSVLNYQWIWIKLFGLFQLLKIVLEKLTK